MTLTTELLQAAEGWEHPVTAYQRALPSPAMLRKAAERIAADDALMRQAADAINLALLYGKRGLFPSEMDQLEEADVALRERLNADR